VTGTTRHAETARMLERAGVSPAVVDVFDASALTAAVSAARPAVVIHQLTDLPHELDEAKVRASAAANARIRREGTRNLIAAAQAAGVHRFIVQSISFAYAPGGEPHREGDPLDLADPMRAVTVSGVVDMERQVLAASGRPTQRCSQSRALVPASTISPTRTGWSRSPRRAPNWTSIPIFGRTSQHSWLNCGFCC
jgi:nucleoside-diphosphate-sugar epimerase